MSPEINRMLAQSRHIRKMLQTRNDELETSLKGLVSAVVLLRVKEEFDCTIVEANDWQRLQDELKKARKVIGYG